MLPGVLELIRVTKPYKLASREMHRHDTEITLPNGKIGGSSLTIMAGPCSVEDEPMILRTAEWLMARGDEVLACRRSSSRGQARTPSRVWA